MFTEGRGSSRGPHGHLTLWHLATECLLRQVGPAQVECPSPEASCPLTAQCNMAHSIQLSLILIKCMMQLVIKQCSIRCVLCRDSVFGFTLFPPIVHNESLQFFSFKASSCLSSSHFHAIVHQHTWTYSTLFGKLVMQQHARTHW